VRIFPLMSPPLGRLLLLLAVGAAAYAPTHLSATVSRRRASPALMGDAISDCPFGTFGLSERERVRFNHLILRHEPLVHEVIGLQVLLGALGSRVWGLAGGLLGSLQFAPCLGCLPGRSGEAFRIVGWHTFVCMRTGAMYSVRLWHASGLQTAVSWCCDVNERIGASARANAACVWAFRRVRLALVGLIGSLAAISPTRRRSPELPSSVKRVGDGMH
jgi:hypothetical protein